MRRWLFPLSSALSLLLFVWAVWLWRESKSIGSGSILQLIGKPGFKLCLSSQDGQLVVGWAFSDSFGTTYLALHEPLVKVGFGNLIGLTAILPAAWAIRFKLRQFQIVSAPNSGVCGTCGYDLRATPDRCPECGKPAP